MSDLLKLYYLGGEVSRRRPGCGTGTKGAHRRSRGAHRDARRSRLVRLGKTSLMGGVTLIQRILHHRDTESTEKIHRGFAQARFLRVLRVSVVQPSRGSLACIGEGPETDCKFPEFVRKTFRVRIKVLQGFIKCRIHSGMTTCRVRPWNERVLFGRTAPWM